MFKISFHGIPRFKCKRTSLSFEQSSRSFMHLADVENNMESVPCLHDTTGVLQA